MAESLLAPLHCLPPYRGVGLVQDRVRVLLPPAQLLLQVPHPPQLLHLPSTGKHVISVVIFIIIVIIVIGLCYYHHSIAINIAIFVTICIAALFVNVVSSALSSSSSLTSHFKTDPLNLKYNREKLKLNQKGKIERERKEVKKEKEECSATEEGKKQ